MLNPQVISPIEEQEARNKVFYLIKKYTSYTFLDQARNLYQQFLDAFERQLRNPSKDSQVDEYTEYLQNQHESEYIHYLDNMTQLESGLNLLKTTKYKREAYTTFLGPDISDRMFDRYADENGIADDPFYISLGLGYSRSTDIFMPVDPKMYSASKKIEHSDYVNLVLIALSYRSLCIRSLASVKTDCDPFAYIDKETTKSSIKWSYETIFFTKEWPPFRDYPSSIPVCPPNNIDPIGEIVTGEEIMITGIYEPWLPIDSKLNMKVRCPNYFLAGTIATNYQLEGTDEWIDVRWRLIWEDIRYLDGTIPEEEIAYTFDLDKMTELNTLANSKKELNIRAGEKIPQTGYWFTVAKENSRHYFKQGDILPNVKSDWGDVYWQFDGE